MKKFSKFEVLPVLVLLVYGLTSCASTPDRLNQFEQFSSTFLEETHNAEQNITTFNNFVNNLADYETRIGTLSNLDYENVEKIIREIPDAKNKMEIQIEMAKDIGKSVTSDGYYSGTKEKVHGWDTGAYTNLHVETTLNNLDKKYANSIGGYKNIHLQLLEKPNKPFNNSVIGILTEVKIDVASAKSDISVKDWNSAKSNVDDANTTLKNAIKLELNNIEQYQVSLLQNDLKDVSNQIALGSAINNTGSILKTAGEGAASILGGLGDILKGAGDRVNKRN